MERKVMFEPAFDRRDPDPAKDYGIHGVNIRFYLIGKHGVTQFVLYTNWQLPHVTRQQLDKAVGEDRLGLECRFLPQAADMGYHSRAEVEHSMYSEKCDVLDGAECWYDGSGLYAEDVYKRLLQEGDAGVWDELERFYIQTFGELE